MLEMFYCTNLVAYFYLRVHVINIIMENHIHGQPTKVHTPSNSDLKFLALQSHNFVTSDTDAYLEKIFECFLKYQGLYRFQVNLNYLYCTYHIHRYKKSGLFPIQFPKFFQSLVHFFGFVMFWGLCAQFAIEGIKAYVRNFYVALNK